MSYYQADPTNVMGRRIGAFFIDLVLIWGIALVLFIALADLTTYEDAAFLGCDVFDDSEFICIENEDSDDLTVLDRDGTVTTGVVWGLSWIANFIVLQGVAGGSVGKLMTGLRVVDGTLRRAGFGRVLVRSLFLIVDLYFCFLVGLITSLVSKGHRRVGDMVAGTYVIKATDVGAPTGGLGSAEPPGWTPPPTAGWSPPGTDAPPAWGPQPQPQPAPPAAPPPPPQSPWGQPPPAPQ